MADNGPGASVAGEGRETVLVVGASSDIGLEIIRQLAPGKPVILAHYNESRDKVEILRRELEDANIVPMQANLGDVSGAEQLITTIRTQHAAHDKIIHLPAPKLRQIRFKDVRWDDFQANLDVQLRSLVLILNAFLPEMAKKGKGKVVVILSSSTCNVPPTALAPYVTTKYALLGLMRALAAEYRANHININGVSPSMVETAFLENLPERMVEIMASQAPWQRTATTRDVASAVRFLLSAEADYITGVNLPVSGGEVF